MVKQYRLIKKDDTFSDAQKHHILNMLDSESEPLGFMMYHLQSTTIWVCKLKTNASEEVEVDSLHHIQNSARALKPGNTIVVVRGADQNSVFLKYKVEEL